MKQSTKKNIAKEILIFFASSIIIGLTWSIFWIYNFQNATKVETLHNEMDIYNHRIDSIQKKLNDPLLVFFNEIKHNKSIEGLPKEYSIFRKVLTDKKNALEFYNLVKNNQSIVGLPESFESFERLLEPLPPRYDIWKKYQDNINLRNEISIEFGVISSKLYTQQELITKLQWIIVIVFAIVYPIRFVILLILWALKTIRLKEI